MIVAIGRLADEGQGSGEGAEIPRAARDGL